MIAKVLRWGNSYGVRISAEDARKLGLREGEEVVVELKSRQGKKVDMSWLRTYRGGGGLARHHDEVEWA